MTGLAARPVVSVWSDPTTTDPQDRVTQLLWGEPVLLGERVDGRVAVRAPWQPCLGGGPPLDDAGYPGWVDADALVDPGGEPAAGVPEDPGDLVTLVAPGARCEPVTGPPVRLSLGTRLRLLDQSRSTVHVELPGRGRAGVPRTAVRLPSEQPATDPAAILAGARRLLGLPYVWGGLGDEGLDCSGLVHLLWRAAGVRVPRDARDQAASLPAVPLDEVCVGDLLFFARPDRPIHHVGIATGRGAGLAMIEASEQARRLVEGPLAAHRSATLVAAARVAPAATLGFRA